MFFVYSLTIILIKQNETQADLIMKEVKTNIDLKKEMYGISRIDDARYRTYAWRVSLIRRGKRLVKNFSDKRYGSREESLAQAKIYRDQLVVEHPPISRKEFSNAKRRNNNSGVTGVYRYAKPYRLRNGTEKALWYWEATWPGDDGKSNSRSFSIARYGEFKARKLAMDARRMV